MFKRHVYGHLVASVAALGLSLAVLAAGGGGSGDVMPPTATPYGYSLDDMAGAVADFSISGNDVDLYPDTPFTILYHRPGDAFTVRAGSILYVKFFFIDDSPPVLGDFPEDKEGAAEYVFGRDQLGAHDLKLVVDGRVTSLDEAGFIGMAPTPTSPDGSENIVQIGAFVTPLTKGVHTVSISGVFDGDAMIEAFGGPFAGAITYTVTVK